ncbi:hypothetical protein DMUE_5947 [Dictyocoela muelleri]|nr:hypothetical protein DMUE_5947 [Dictyocoela muelleri]
MADNEKDYLPTYIVLHEGDNLKLDCIFDKYLYKDELSTENYIVSKDDSSEIKIIASLEAFKMIELLRKYYLQIIPEKINNVWRIEDDLESERENRKSKITDFLAHR